MTDQHLVEDEVVVLRHPAADLRRVRELRGELPRLVGVKQLASSNRKLVCNSSVINRRTCTCMYSMCKCFIEWNRTRSKDRYRLVQILDEPQVAQVIARHVQVAVKHQHAVALTSEEEANDAVDRAATPSGAHIDLIRYSAILIFDIHVMH